MLSLENFDTQISAVIVKRGKEYYQNGAVTDIEQTGKNYWQGQIEGSDTYSVEIKLTAGKKIDEYSCDCPFDGSICKHIAAFLFAIRDELNKPETKIGKNINKNVFETVLKKTHLEELQNFVRQHALKDKNFKTQFELHFAEKDDRIDISIKYAELIKKAVKKHSDRGFLDYRATINIAREIDDITNTGNDFIRKGNYRDAFLLAKTVLKEAVEIVTYCDDSNGSMGGAVDGAIRLIELIATSKDAAIELLEQLFVFLQTELKEDVYFSYGDFGYDLFSIFQNLALQLNRQEDFLAFIDMRIAGAKGEHDGYRREHFKTSKIDFLKAAGRNGEAEKLVEQNMDIVEIRQGEVRKAIAKKDFEYAKKLINDGIKIAEGKKHPGTVTQWEKELLHIAVLEKNIEAVRYYTKRFAFDHWFNKEYYNEFKKTYITTEWKEVIEKYIEEQIKHITQEHKKNKNNSWYQPNPPLLDKLAPVYIEEQYWDRLLELVQKETDIDTVLKYHDYLVKRYPAELLEIYLPLFNSGGDKANDRNSYAALVSKMQKVMKDIPTGKEKIIAVAQSLKQKYPRRPAMIDELNKITK